MILCEYSISSYLSKPKLYRHVCNSFFLGTNAAPHTQMVDMPQQNNPMHIHCGVLPYVLAYAMEGKLGSLFSDFKHDEVILMFLQEMGHIQPATTISTDNLTSTEVIYGIAKKDKILVCILNGWKFSQKTPINILG